jgi:toxin HigB-1
VQTTSEVTLIWIQHIIAKLTAWINAVGHYGLNQVRKIPGYHGEPLLGERKGQRSIRLSKSYRATYLSR